MDKAAAPTERGRLLWEAANRAGFTTAGALSRHLASSDGAGPPDYRAVERWRREISRWTNEEGVFNQRTATFLAEKLGTEVDYWPTTRRGVPAQSLTALRTELMDLREQLDRQNETLGQLADAVNLLAENQQRVLDAVDALEQSEPRRKRERP